MSIEVAAAQPSEEAACLAFLRQAWNRPAVLLIARRDGVLAGAGAIVWRERDAGEGFPLWLRVGRGHRRRGVGRALLAAAADRVAGETGALAALRPVQLGGGPAKFMQACGFTVAQQEFGYRVAAADLLAILQPLADRARRPGDSLADVVVSPLREDDVEELAWLVGGEFHRSPLDMAQELRGRIARQGPVGIDRSSVARQGGRILGVVLWRVDGTVAAVEGWVVSPSVRGGALSALMLHHETARGIAEGFAELRFHALDTAASTLALARRSGAALDTERARYRLDLAAS